MLSVLIIVTSSTVRTGISDNLYNEQEVGLAKALIRKGYKAGIAYYGKNKELHDKLKFKDGEIDIHLFKGVDILKTSFFRNHNWVLEQYDILMPISYDHFETYHIAMKYPEKTVVYNGTYYADFNKRYNLKCKVVDPFFLPGYKRMRTPFLMKNRLSQKFMNSKGIDNTKVIGVGFDKEQMMSKEMLPSDMSEKIRREKQKNRILLYIGRLEPRRNIDFLLRIFSTIRKEAPVKLVVIGKGSDKYVSRCKALAQQLGIVEDILYRESLEQKYLPLIYTLADLFVLPTSYEIFGMVILEAMYFGTPVLTTLNGGSDILIENGKTGYIIPILEVEKWAKKVKSILEHDNDEICRLAYERIENLFVWDVLVDKFTDTYFQLINLK